MFNLYVATLNFGGITVGVFTSRSLALKGIDCYVKLHDLDIDSSYPQVDKFKLNKI